MENLSRLRTTAKDIVNSFPEDSYDGGKLEPQNFLVLAPSCILIESPFL